MHRGKSSKNLCQVIVWLGLCLTWTMLCAHSASGVSSKYNGLSSKVKNAARARAGQEIASRIAVSTSAEVDVLKENYNYDVQYDKIVGENLGKWYHHIDATHDFRLSDREFKDKQRIMSVPNEVLQQLHQFEHNARTIEQQLCIQIPSGVENLLGDRDNPRNDWRDEKELQLRLSQLRQSVGCTTTKEAVEEAIKLLRSGSVLVKPHWTIRTTILEKGREVALQMPIIRHVGQLYNILHFHSLRELIIDLIEHGVDINTATPNVLNAVPVVFSILGSFHLDYILHRHILHAQPKVNPVLSRSKYREGFSMPHFYAERTIAVITKHIIQTGDHMRYANVSFEEAVKQLADHPDGLGSEWRGDLYKTEFLSLHMVSPLYRSIVKHFDTDGPDKYLPLSAASGVADELFLQLMNELFEFSNYDLTEVSIRLPMVFFNIMHIMVLNNYPKSIKVLIQAYHNEISSANATRKFQLQRAFKTALIQEDGTGRNPIHQAALLYGMGNPVTRALVSFERELHGSTERLRTRKDGLGNSVFDYINGTARFATARKVLKSGKEAQELLDLKDARDKTIKELKQVEDPLFNPNVNISNTGGWKEYGHRSDLQTKPKDRCDIRTYDGMPSFDELKIFLESNKPIIMRGAGKHLSLPKYLWARENLLKRFQNAAATISRVPYTHQTDSPYKPKTSYETTVGDFIANFSKGNGPDLPMYLFASDFYLRNPLLLENMTAPFDVIRQITDTRLQQGTPSSDWAGLERNAQMYLGAYLPK